MQALLPTHYAHAQSSGICQTIQVGQEGIFPLFVGVLVPLTQAGGEGVGP